MLLNHSDITKGDGKFISLIIIIIRIRKMEPKDLLAKIITIYEGYSNEYRASTQPYHLQKVRDSINDYNYHFEDKLVREPLIEHVGSLPIVASTVYPFIKDDSVDLGRAMIIFSIHDIGEIVTGDEITFTKKKDVSNNEYEEALKLIHPSLHKYYDEIEELETSTAKFAKAIDKMTADIVDLMTPASITIERYSKHLGKSADEIVPLIKEFKHPYMIWNDYLTELHLEVMRQLENQLKQ